MTPVETVDDQITRAHRAYLRALWNGDEEAVTRALTRQDELLEQRQALTHGATL